VLVCLPITATRLFGYDAYSVVSGSMEPAIPTGSLVYVQETAPEDMKEDDVIAFYGAKDSNAIITHRVVENKVVMGEFITKGDANKTEDMNAVPYSNFIGKVVYTIPVLGKGRPGPDKYNGKDHCRRCDCGSTGFGNHSICYPQTRIITVSVVFFVLSVILYHYKKLLYENMIQIK